MYQDLNDNFALMDYQAGPCLALYRQRLPVIQEGLCLELDAFEKDINLECNEVIDDWDELDAYNVFSRVKNERFSNMNFRQAQVPKCDYLAMYDDLSLIVDDKATTMYDEVPVLESKTLDTMYDDTPSRNVLTHINDIYTDTDLLYNGDCVNNMLEHLKDKTENLSFSAETEQAKFSQEVDGSQSSTHQETKVQESVDTTSIKHFNLNNSRSEHVCDVLVENAVSLHSVFPPTPRTSSPEMFELTSGIRYEYARSISPLRMRSPSPLSSRSSSPRFVRSPSPDEIHDGILGSPVASISDGHVEDEQFMLHRNVPYSNSDHLVPDVENDFQHIVNDSPEFPTHRQYLRQRMAYTCQDHLVPQIPEE